MSTGWLDHFEAFSLTHAATLAAWAALTAAIILIGTRQHGRAAARMDRVLGVMGLIAWIGVNAWWLAPANFEWQRSLPLQICDLAALAAPLAFLTHTRFFRIILYFWGVGLSSQGLLTPIVSVGPAHAEFWIAWINHGVIGTFAIYDVVVRGYRPTRRDALIAILTAAAFIALILPVNIATGWNYAYVGDSRPGSPTLIDHLGPWPLRILWIALLAILAMILALLPWEIVRRRTPDPTR
ncbi:MAG: TIGR02206 family membrane protein [Phycisphaerae bacterium]|nr:TIGR02206 family membrane protein [Phycisphaerae bacterium]